MRMRHGSRQRDIAMDDPGLRLGWWAVEWAGPSPCRRTNGDAVLPVLGCGVLEVELDGNMMYALHGAEPVQRAAA
jgi:hypothetical protein